MNTTVFNIQHFSLHDGPGIRTVIFFKGCPLDCAWCHNPESKSFRSELSFTREKCVLCAECASVCDEGVHSVYNGKHFIDRTKCISCGKCVEVCPTSSLQLFGKTFTEEQIFEEIEKDSVFFGDDGGITISGGEPFAQFDALVSLLRQCKKRGYSTCIETSGYTTLERIKKAAEYTDIFLYDCKETDPDAHKKYTGVGNESILSNLCVLDEVNANVILRCPIVKGVNDRVAHYEDIAKLANAHSSIKSIEIMPYHPLGIEKSERIGKEISFADTEFLNSNIAEACLSVISSYTQKLVKISQ